MTTIETQSAPAGVRGGVVHQNECLRHGDWLFVPSPGLVVDTNRIRRHAAVRREAPVVEELYRTGGEAVYFSESKRQVLTVPQYRKLLRQRPSAVKEDWRIRQRDAADFVRGTVLHPEYSPITLPGWHRILMNTGSLAQSLRHGAIQE